MLEVTQPYVNASNRDRCFAVYAIYDGTNQLVLIGSCKADRVFTLPDARRNSEWIRLFEKTDAFYRIEVLSYDPDRITAARYMHDLIQRYRPPCNVKGIVHSLGKRVQCIETGEIFASITETARLHNLSLPQLSNHINRKKGYATVKGHTYKHIV